MGDPLSYWDFAGEGSSGSSNNTGNPPQSNQPTHSSASVSSAVSSLVGQPSTSTPPSVPSASTITVPAAVSIASTSSLGKTLLFTSSEHSTQVLGGFNHLWTEGALCDVILIAENRRFDAHRIVLASCSHYFRTMFTRDFQESQLKEIELKGVTSLGLRAVLDFVYTSRLALNSNHIHDILQTASHLQFNQVIDYCCQFLKSEIDVDNCFEFSDIAELYQLTPVQEHVENFILKNFERVSENDQFITLSHHQLCHFLSSDKLQSSSELRVFQIALRWLQHDVETRTEFASQVLSNIRFSVMTPDEIIEHVQQAKVMAANESCAKLLFQAMNFHLKPTLQPLMSSHLTQPRGSTTHMITIGGNPEDSSLPLIKQIDYLDMEKGTFTSKSKRLTEMAIPHAYGAVVVYQNFLFVLGGDSDRCTNDRHAVKHVYRYSPNFDTWMQMASMNEERATFCAMSVGHHVIAVGGRNRFGSLSTAEKYDFKKNKWDYIAPLSASTHGHAGCVAKGNVYISGGSLSGHVSNKFMCYSPADDQWTSKLSMMRARMYHGMVSVKDKIYVFGGNYVNTNALRCDALSTECFDPDTEQWTTLTSMCRGQGHTFPVYFHGFICNIGGYTWNSRNFLDLIQRYDVEKDRWEVMDAKVSRNIAGIMCCTLQLPPRITQAYGNDP